MAWKEKDEIEIIMKMGNSNLYFYLPFKISRWCPYNGSITESAAAIPPLYCNFYKMFL
jgi:hypothetical protein